MSSLLICQLCQLLVCFFGPLTELEFVAAEDDMELIQMMASLGLPTTCGTSSGVTLCNLSPYSQSSVQHSIEEFNFSGFLHATLACVE
jgi:hypothetical protein